jgi:glycosyltransferase involved in cell wall biosynthesis
MNACRKRLVVVAGHGPEPAETFIRRDLAALRRLGWATRCFGLDHRFAPPAAMRGDAPPESPAELPPLVPALLSRSRSLAGSPRQVVALLRSWRLAQAVAHEARGADLILAEFAWLTADVAAVASYLSGTPWVCAVHAWDVFAQPRRAIHSRLGGAAGVVACSDAARQAVLDAGIPADRVVRIHHGLPLDDYPCRAAQPAADDCLAAVGRLEPKKGFDQLIEAWAGLPRRPTAMLHLVGDGGARSALERSVARLRLGDQVRFHGQVPPDEARRILSEATLLVLPSRRLPDGDRDGIANVLLEAMALGVPVVTTLAGAAAEVIDDRRNGLLVPPDDVPALMRAIGSLMASRTLRETVARGGRATVEAHFDGRLTGAALADWLLSHAVVRASSSLRQPAP